MMEKLKAVRGLGDDVDDSILAIESTYIHLFIDHALCLCKAFIILCHVWMETNSTELNLKSEAGTDVICV